MASRSSLQHAVRVCTLSPCRQAYIPMSIGACMQSTSFSTSSRLSYPMPAKKKGGEAKATKGQKQLRLGKSRKKPNETSRGPSIEERKALKKRVVLSNTNALPVEKLRILDGEALEDKNILGSMVKLTDETIDQLRAVEAFKTTQGWKHYRSPCVMVTKESMRVMRWIDSISNSPNPETIRKVVVGDRSSGKSTLLLQAMAAAFLKGWVVVNIPDAKDLVVALTDYAPLPDTSPMQYVQRSYMSTLLGQMEKANGKIFSTMILKQSHPSLPIPVQKDTTLSRLCQVGSSNPEFAWPLFIAVWKELTAPSTHTPPILLAADGLGHIMGLTAYLDPTLKRIHAHDLAIVHHFIQNLSGSSPLPNGGLVLAATTESNAPDVPAMRQSLLAAKARATGLSQANWNEHRPLDVRVLSALKDISVLRMQGLSKDEARTVLDYYARSGLVRQRVDDKFVGEKWTMSGGGIIGELEKAVVVMGSARI